MGIRRALGLAAALPLPVADAPARIVSPWSGPSHLETVALPDILGADNPTITRATAMRVPAVARARHLIAATIARCPLTTWRGPDQIDPAKWTYREALGTTAYHRMLWTVDDLLFHGWSLWTVDRDATGQPARAARLPYEWWNVGENGVIYAKFADADTPAPLPAANAVLIPGAHEGILSFGVDAIRQAADLSATVTERARYPEALVELHYTGDHPMTDPEIGALLQTWLKARAKTGGSAVAFTPKNVEAKTHGESDAALLIDGRNAAALEIARIVGIPAAMLDATAAAASLTYETTEGRNGQFLDYGLAAYLDPIAARLSADDMTPRGISTRFDTSVIQDLTRSATGPATED